MADADIRTILAEAISFVRGREYTKQVLGWTLEDLIGQRIDDIKDDSNKNRVSEITKITKIRDQLDSIQVGLEEEDG